MTRSRDGSGELLPLTGVRAVAALWVVSFHFSPELIRFLPGGALLRPVFEAGYLGVDLFFVLSGFIISYNYLESFATVERDGYRRFMLLRLGRIYPVHFFTLGLTAVAVAMAARLAVPINHLYAFDSTSFVRNLFLVQAWGPSHLSWNGPSWSISAEWFAYLAFPFLATRLGRIMSPRMCLAGAGLSFVGMLAVLAMFGFQHGSTDLALIRVAGEFTAGAFLFVLYRHQWKARVAWDRIGWASIILVALLILLIPATHSTTNFQLWVAPIFGVTVLALAYAKGTLASFLSLPWIVVLGRASYSIYMTHTLSLAVVRKVVLGPNHVHSALAAGLLTVLAVAAVMAFGIIVYVIVEEKARQLFRDLASPADTTKNQRRRGR